MSNLTHQEILTKAIQKAIEGGWSPVGKGFTWKVEKNIGVVPYLSAYYSLDDNKPHYGDNEKHKIMSLNDIIFNHDFARALWGEKLITIGSHYEGGPVTEPIILDKLPEWQYHLQQMVISDNPIKYLAENLDNKQ